MEQGIEQGKTKGLLLGRQEGESAVLTVYSIANLEKFPGLMQSKMNKQILKTC